MSVLAAAHARSSSIRVSETRPTASSAWTRSRDAGPAGSSRRPSRELTAGRSAATLPLGSSGGRSGAEGGQRVLTASEFAFLALGLVLGVASGAALIEVLRARPPVSREVRVTVAPNAIHARMGSTLADPNGVGDAVGPARGGPGDRRWRDEVLATGEPAATGRRPGQRGSGGDHDDVADRSGTPVRVSSEARGSLVAVPMSMEPDPVTTALRAGAAPPAMASMVGSASTVAARTGSITATATLPDPKPRRRWAEPLPQAPPRAPRPARPALRTAPPLTPDRPPAPLPVRPASRAHRPIGPAGPRRPVRRVATGRGRALRGRRASARGRGGRRREPAPDAALVRRARGRGRGGRRRRRSARRSGGEGAAQQRFRDARNRAGTRDDVENGARAWLAEINRINHDTREAALAHRARPGRGDGARRSTVERLAVEADAARISAERADEACVAAREAVAACDEAAALEAAAARSAAAAGQPPAEEADDVAAAAGPSARASRIAAATPEPGGRVRVLHADELAGRPGRADPADPARRPRGDAACGRPTGRGRSRRPASLWQGQLGAFVEALVARSIEASAFDFPIDQPFWGAVQPGPEPRHRAGPVVARLSGSTGSAAGSTSDQPSQRDLSLAVGYAGLDPMRIRRWPTEAETATCIAEVRVAADEYLAGAAGGLTLGELVALLGRRADGLAELWNEWGRGSGALPAQADAG